MSLYPQMNSFPKEIEDKIYEFDMEKRTKFDLIHRMMKWLINEYQEYIKDEDISENDLPFSEMVFESLRTIDEDELIELSEEES